MVVAKVTGVDICSLWLVDENSNPPKIRLKATQAIEPEYMIDRSLNWTRGSSDMYLHPKTPGHTGCAAVRDIQGKGDGEKAGPGFHGGRAAPGQKG